MVEFSLDSWLLGSLWLYQSRIVVPDYAADTSLSMDLFIIHYFYQRKSLKGKINLPTDFMCTNFGNKLLIFLCFKVDKTEMTDAEKLNIEIISSNPKFRGYMVQVIYF